MTIYFKLEKDEKTITPIKVAEALIKEDELFTKNELEEIARYLLVYTEYSR